MKDVDRKKRDKWTAPETAGLEFAGPENAGMENAWQKNGGKPQNKPQTNQLA